MRVTALIFILSAMAVSCSEDEPTEGCAPVSDPLKEIASLSNIAEKGIVPGRPSCIVYGGARIFACKYNGNTVYYFSNPASSTAVCGFIAYDCGGDELLNRGVDAASWDAFAEGRTEEVELWVKK